MTTTPSLPEQLTPARLDRDEAYRVLDLLQDRASQQATLPGLDQLAPGFPDWIVTALFGGTYLREGLSPRDRQLVNLAALTALGGVDPQLASHVRTSLRVGMSRKDIVEVFVHLAPYVGVPKALAGLRVAAAALAEAENADEQEATR
ncbi:carboxymuconolactone decarboxylase family protein [Streptoalloteichus hindustanus]|uniref:4-carboxymuconolactone decarboxylase n=1 Tax=Streptoalloteichus hindustanus TaxID=2017 RepID=A0A1M5PVR7_STRHI|nr:carboxymuconolactone decarboxylase family protein [Streptoalloteichus hindustanus]SHH05519.1 4-carboxymuconolactone decarboxylase [Streptoalloteichus hindustanus]